MTMIFLGGTAANNDWRTRFTKELVNIGFKEDQIFNPVVADWNDEARQREEKAKSEAAWLVFYLADPKQDGSPVSAYSMVEAVMALYDKPHATVVVFDVTEMSGHALKQMNQTAAVLRTRFPKGNIFSTPKEAIDWFANKSRS